MRIVVTGSSGLVGSRLVRRFKERGQTVVGVDRERGTPGVVDGFVEGDLAKEAVRKQASEEASAIVHLAASCGRPIVTTDMPGAEKLYITVRMEFLSLQMMVGRV
jgi:nucleoside-diphosphate-sugar epimerase